MTKIVIDIMGADIGFEPIVSGIAKALSSGLDFFPVLVGPGKAKDILNEAGIDPARYELVDAVSYIRNQDPPTAIFGEGNPNSMAIAYDRLKNDCDALLSAGNTGALLVLPRLSLSLT